MREPSLVGDADCVRPGCPSDKHDVTFLYDDEGYIVSTIFTCKVCASEVPWVSESAELDD